MLEMISKAVEVAKEVASQKLKDLTPDFLKEKTIGPEKGVPDSKLKADIVKSAKIAQSFFELNNIPIKEGPGVAVQLRDKRDIKDDVFVFNAEQFKKMGCTSVTEMTKIWSHECGHRILQDKNLSTWSFELGADFLMGARCGMLGIPSGATEKFLTSQPASTTHPNGALRRQAIALGRFVVADMKRRGIKPTWQNCFEAFKNTSLARLPETRMMAMNNPFMQNPLGQVGLINNRAYNIGKANEYKSKGDLYTKKSNEAIRKGDLKSAESYARTAQGWYKDSKSSLNSAGRCTK